VKGVGEDSEVAVGTTYVGGARAVTPHLGIIVVSGQRVIYTIITMRVSYDTFITYYLVLS
jgi:hypothetical protein